jgi:hypothetical protein
MTSEFEKRRKHPIEYRSPQPRVAKKKSRNETREQRRHVFTSPQKMQQAECEDAHDERPAGRLGQQANNAQPAFAYPGESRKQSAKQQPGHGSACIKIIGQHPDNKEAGIGHRAGQSYQHQ